MINKNFINKIILLVVISLTFGSTISTLMIGTVKAEDDWVKITSPANGDELCVGTIAMIRFDTVIDKMNYDNNFIGLAVDVSKTSDPNMTLISGWQTINVINKDKLTVGKKNQVSTAFEVESKYLSLKRLIIRVRQIRDDNNYSIENPYDTCSVIITDKPVLNAVNWIDDKPLGNRKPLILVNGIELSFNMFNKRLRDNIPQEKQWDNLLLYLYNKDNKVIIDNFKPYLFLYDSNDTDNTFPSEDGISAVAKYLERRLIEKNLNSNLHFIAHSMGGLVCRQYLSNNSNKVNRIICLFTPHHGSMLPNYPPTLLEINNSQGLSKFLKDISWDYDMSDFGDTVNPSEVDDYVRLAGITKTYFKKGENIFLNELNTAKNSNFKVFAYYGENNELSLESLESEINYILSNHWSMIFSGLMKWAEKNGVDSSKLSGFINHDGVVQSRSGWGFGLGFQAIRFCPKCDHVGWSNDDFNLKDLLFGQIIKDLDAPLSQTTQPNPPSELLPAPTVKPAIKMDNGDIKLEWSELKDTGVYYVEVAQRKNYTSSVKTNDYSSPYQIWTIGVPEPYVAVPYAYFIDGAEYVWHVRAGSKSNVLGKYSSNGTFTYSKNSLDFGPPEIVSPGASEEIIKVTSQDLNSITLTWKLDTKYAGKVDHYTYELSTKPYWSKPYLLDYRGVNIPSSRRSETIQLKPGSYYWRICSNDSSGKDNGWSVSCKFTLVYTPQAVCSHPAPKNFNVDQSCSPKKIALSWNAPQEEGCDLTGYELNYSYGGNKYSAKLKENDKSYTLPLSNVVEEKEYVFEICAIYGDKKSATTTRTYFTCKECSKPPEKLSSPPVGKLDVAKKTIVFTWDEPLMQSSCKIKHYVISYRKNGVEEPSLGSSTVSVRSVTLQKGLSQGFEYQIGVKAVNDVGPASGDPVLSNKVKFEFNCDPTTPGKPMAQNISTLCADGFMVFKWDASTVMGGCDPLLGYVVKAEYNKTTLNLVLNFTASNMYKLPLDKAGLYRIQVIAGGKVESQWSDEVEYDCSSVNCTPPPAGLKLEPSGNKMVMSWVKPVISKTCSQIVKYKYRYYIEPKPATIDIKETTDTTVGSWYLSSGKATYCFQAKAVYSDGKESDWAPSNDKWEKITYTNNPTPNPPSKDCKPSTPVLKEPDVDCQGRIIKFSWSKSQVPAGCTKAVSYTLAISKNNGNYSEYNANSEYHVMPANNGDVFQYKIKAVSNDGESAYSSVEKYTVDCLDEGQPGWGLTWPNNNMTINKSYVESQKLVLEWNKPFSWADSYIVEIYKDDIAKNWMEFSCSFGSSNQKITLSTNDTSCMKTLKLEYGSKYQWRVGAKNSKGSDPNKPTFSAVYTFFTTQDESKPPTAPNTPTAWADGKLIGLGGTIKPGATVTFKAKTDDARVKSIQIGYNSSPGNIATLVTGTSKQGDELQATWKAQEGKWSLYARFVTDADITSDWTKFNGNCDSCDPDIIVSEESANATQNYICTTYALVNPGGAATPIIIKTNQTFGLQFLPCQKGKSFKVKFEVLRKDPKNGEMMGQSEIQSSFFGDPDSEGYRYYDGNGNSFTIQILFNVLSDPLGKYFVRFNIKGDQNWFYIDKDLKFTTKAGIDSPTFTVIPETTSVLIGHPTDNHNTSPIENYTLFTREIGKLVNSENLLPDSTKDKTYFRCANNKPSTNQCATKPINDCAKLHQDDPFDLALIKNELGDRKRIR